MATIADNAGPWGMLVISFDEADPQNPVGRLRPEEITRLPFGAMELNEQGGVVSFHDTEPDLGGGDKGVSPGRNLFTEVSRWAGDSVVQQHFREGVQSGQMNVVFDCALPNQAGKIRIHLKVSPILGTFWMFMKRLRR